MEFSFNPKLGFSWIVDRGIFLASGSFLLSYPCRMISYLSGFVALCRTVRLWEMLNIETLMSMLILILMVEERDTELSAVMSDE